MIKIEVCEEHNSVEIQGTPIDITAETLFSIQMVYEAIKEKDEQSAECFRKAVTDSLEQCFMSEDEREKAIQKRLNKQISSLNKSLKEILELLGTTEDDDHIRFRS